MIKSNAQVKRTRHFNCIGVLIFEVLKQREKVGHYANDLVLNRTPDKMNIMVEG